MLIVLAATQEGFLLGGCSGAGAGACIICDLRCRAQHSRLCLPLSHFCKLGNNQNTAIVLPLRSEHLVSSQWRPDTDPTSATAFSCLVPGTGARGSLFVGFPCAPLRRNGNAGFASCVGTAARAAPRLALPRPNLSALGGNPHLQGKRTSSQPHFNLFIS